MVSCRHLVVVGFVDKSDPFVELFVKEEKDKEWTSFGRTEVVTDNLSPNFTHRFDIPYYFEKN